MRLGITAVALGAAIAFTAPAEAATVTLEGDTLVMRAADAAVQNQFLVKQVDGGGRLQLSDVGESITAFPASCTQEGYFEDTIDCAIPAGVRLELGPEADSTLFNNLPAIKLEVLGGAGDDTFDLIGADGASSRLIDGQDGNDRVYGSNAADTVRGGVGNDTVGGYGGADTVLGGDGDDTMAGDDYPQQPQGPMGADVVDGGAGTDSFTDYDETSAPVAVTVSLDGAANDGRPGENDNLIAIETIHSFVGGSYTGSEGADTIWVFDHQQGRSTIRGLGGNDRLEGTRGTEEDIDGGTGDDHIEGGFGNDTLTGGPGRDVILGDEGDTFCGWAACRAPYGNDVIQARDGEQDSIDCGVGDDQAVVDADDLVVNCERVDKPQVTPPGPGPATQRCTRTPKVRNLTLVKARRKLKAAGCSAKVKKARSRKVRKGRVVKATRKGTVVTLVVSRGR